MSASGGQKSERLGADLRTGSARVSTIGVTRGARAAATRRQVETAVMAVQVLNQDSLERIMLFIVRKVVRASCP